MRRAMVVLSGGQDSATCAAWANYEFKGNFECVSFNYGQRHRRELNAAMEIAKLFDVTHYVVDMPALRGNPASGLTSDAVNPCETDPQTGLPKSFVPGRNLVFLTAAASIALGRGITELVTGVCQTDYSGYPDCRENTIKALELAIALGNEGFIKGGGFRIHTPLMWLTKAHTVGLAWKLPKGQEAVALSWTCYLGGAEPCGKCPACVLRAKGFADAGVADPALIHYTEV